MKTAQHTKTLRTDVNKKAIELPMVSDPALRENGGAAGATDLGTEWNDVSGALIYEWRIYKEYEFGCVSRVRGAP
jgi:hypothetical protein